MNIKRKRTKGKIHKLSVLRQFSVCGLFWRENDGVKDEDVVETSQEVTCKHCLRIISEKIPF